MQIDIVTIFPKMFAGPFEESILKRAQEKGLVDIKAHDLREWTNDKHKTVDDSPYGGGPGMVMMIEPLYKAVQQLKMENGKLKKRRVILLTPQGKTFDQAKAQELSKIDHLIFICGHYEGVDERVREHLADEEISIGDYVLTGGELPAMIVVDSIVRLIPRVLGKEASLDEESFSNGLLEYPHYTRPETFHDWKVPEILLSGNHAEISKWRKEQALKRTKHRRPDLWK